MVQFELPHQLDRSGIATLLGYPEESIPGHCDEHIASHSFSYRPLSQVERDSHMLRVYRRLEEEKLNRSTSENIAAFEHGWRENLELCIRDGLSRDNLRPKYVRPYSCIRLKGDYVAPQDPYLCDELLWLTVNWSFSQYFQDVESVVEFGCGTGRYVFDLAHMFPNKRICGTDWTSSSGQIIKMMADAGLNVTASRFDMLNPDSSFELSEGAGILTVGALEQIGNNFDQFLGYILSQKPSIVVHHEPIEDFYEEDSLVDYLGRTYHRRRGYLVGYIEALRDLEKKGIIQIVEAKRVPFGDPFHESCSRVVWKLRSSQ